MPANALKMGRCGKSLFFHVPKKQMKNPQKRSIFNFGNGFWEKQRCLDGGSTQGGLQDEKEEFQRTMRETCDRQMQ